MDPKQDQQGPAKPGTPLEPDELEGPVPEFQSATQAPRQAGASPKGHPTSELSSTPRHARGPATTPGKHPTSELAVKPKR